MINKVQRVINRLFQGARPLMRYKDVRATTNPHSLLQTQYSPVDSKTVEAYNKVRSFGPKPVMCYAPFNSMVFDVIGIVKACCHSYKASEKYPEKSIKEIWFGGVFKQLREHMEHSSLPPACAVCRAQLESGEFYGVKSRTFDAFLPVKDGYPTVMEFCLENTCNLECIMCIGENSSSIRKNREKLPPLEKIYGDTFVDELEEFIPYLQKASFVGGEPFLINIYYRIWERLIELNPNCKISITTNGTILNSKVKNILEKGNFEIILSLDGITKETYESIRLNANFESVMANLEYFQLYTKRKGGRLEIDPCPQKKNWHEMPKITEFANKHNNLLYFSVAVRYPYDVCLWTLPSAELSEIGNYLSSFDFPSETATQKHNLEIYNDFIVEVRNWERIARAKELIMEKKIQPQIDPAFKERFYEQLREFISNDERLANEDRNKKTNLIISKVEHFLSSVPINFDQDDFFNYLSEIPMPMLIWWAETATHQEIANRFKYELESPYR